MDLRDVRGNTIVHAGSGADVVDIRSDTAEVLVVSAGEGDDLVTVWHAGTIGTIQIDTGTSVDSGSDQVVLSSLGVDVSVETGHGDDRVTFRTLGDNTAVALDAGSGNDSVEIRSVGSGNVARTFKGGAGDDTFRVNAAETLGTLMFYGGDHIEGDQLVFDPQGYFYDNEQENTFQLVDPDTHDAYGPLHRWDTVEVVEIIEPKCPSGVVCGPLAFPIPEIKDLPQINEGADFALSFPYVSSKETTFEWDFNGDAIFGDILGATVWSPQDSMVEHTVAWADLEDMGIRDDGQYLITLRATDDSGDTGQTSAVLTVLNANPVITLINGIEPPLLPNPIDEGSRLVLTVQATDPARFGDPLEYDFDFDNDGIYEVSNNFGVAEHTFSNDGTYTIAIRVRDDDGGSAISTTTVTVNNVAPQFPQPGQVGAQPPIVYEGSLVSLDAAVFRDPGTLDTHTATINWADGTEEPAAVSERDGTWRNLRHSRICRGWYVHRGSHCAGR